jgi:hypothetical protein
MTTSKSRISITYATHVTARHMLDAVDYLASVAERAGLPPRVASRLRSVQLELKTTMNNVGYLRKSESKRQRAKAH